MALPPPTAIWHDPNLSYETKQWLHEVYKPGWRDITSEITVRGVGANNPTWAQIGTGPFFGYNFAVNDECWMSFHIPHDYVPGSDIHFHAHWLADGTDGNDVVWQWEYMYAHGHNQQAFAPAGTSVSATATISNPDTGVGTQYLHHVTETAAVSITDMEVDGIIYCCITRITNGATDNADSIFLLTSDIHYYSDNRSTKNKAPDFYR